MVVLPARDRDTTGATGSGVSAEVGGTIGEPHAGIISLSPRSAPRHAGLAPGTVATFWWTVPLYMYPQRTRRRWHTQQEVTAIGAREAPMRALPSLTFDRALLIPAR